MQQGAQQGPINDNVERIMRLKERGAGNTQEELRSFLRSFVRPSIKKQGDNESQFNWTTTETRRDKRKMPKEKENKKRKRKRERRRSFLSISLPLPSSSATAFNERYARRAGRKEERQEKEKKTGNNREKKQKEWDPSSSRQDNPFPPLCQAGMDIVPLVLVPPFSRAIG